MLLLSSFFYIQVNQRQSTQKRVSTMNSFLDSAEKDLERQIYVSGYRIVLIFEKRVLDSNTYIPESDFNNLFSEAFFNGTIDHQNQDIMNGATYSALLSSIVNNAKKININFNLTNPSINITQEDPWRVAIVLTANLTMSDDSNLASWNKPITIKSYISIENFEDPVYLINTGKGIHNQFIKTPYIFSSTNSENLSIHVQSSYYIASTDAPSFIDRLKGKLTSNQYGIESMVNLQKLSQQGITIVDDKSIIDHIYFSASSPSLCSPVPAGLPNWFKIDAGHKTAYNITTC